MEKDVARLLLEQVLHCYALLDEAALATRDLQEPERIRMQRAIAEAIGHLNSEVEIAITWKYPDLDPLLFQFKPKKT